MRDPLYCKQCFNSGEARECVRFTDVPLSSESFFLVFDAIRIVDVRNLFNDMLDSRLFGAAIRKGESVRSCTLVLPAISSTIAASVVLRPEEDYRQILNIAK